MSSAPDPSPRGREALAGPLLLKACFWLAVAVTCWFAFGPAPAADVPGRDKTWHFITFSTLGLLAAFAHPGVRLVTLAVMLLAGGVLIEAIQALPVVGRDASLGDLVADMVGAAVAVLVAGFARSASRRA